MNIGLFKIFFRCFFFLEYLVGSLFRVFLGLMKFLLVCRVFDNYLRRFYGEKFFIVVEMKIGINSLYDRVIRMLLRK